jgi:hypothetical protein
VLEEVAENDLEVDLTTADVKGAFDSSERKAQKLAGNAWGSLLP